MVTKDSQGTRAKILDAATQAFVNVGPAGARVDAIAAAAGVNKRMLYHHFGDKQGLYQAVLANSQDALPGAGGQLSPERARLLAWEGLLEPTPLGSQDPKVVDSTDAQLFALLQRALQVFPHVCGPEVKRLTGMTPGSDAFEAAMGRLGDRLQHHLAPAPSVQAHKAKKAKVTLRARSSTPEGGG